MKDLTEWQLIEIAESHNDEVANEAMAELRKRFDYSYRWCAEMDYMVVKQCDLQQCECNKINQEQ